MKKKSPLTISPQEGEYLSVVGDTYRIIIGGEQTENAFAVIDMLIPPGGGPGPHAHADFNESFYVIDGEIEVTSEEGSYTAKKGAFVSIPKGGIVHMFKNRTESAAHILCTVVPAGLERFFKEIGKPVEAGQFLPPPEMNPEKAKRLAGIATRYGQKVYPPNYLDEKAGKKP